MDQQKKRAGKTIPGVPLTLAVALNTAPMLVASSSDLVVGSALTGSTHHEETKGESNEESSDANESNEEATKNQNEEAEMT